MASTAAATPLSFAHLDRVADAQEMSDGRHVATPVPASPRDVQDLPQQPLVKLPRHLRAGRLLPPAAAPAPSAVVRAMVGDVPDQEVSLVVVDQPVGEVVDIVAVRISVAWTVHRAADRC